METLDAHRTLTAPDGMDYWRRHMHARCDHDARPFPITCPWCEEFDGPSLALTQARQVIAAARAQS
jgi:hypothetical protein